MPRGNGKSWLAAHLLSRFLTPGDPIHVSGKEAVLLSGSIEQARIVFRFCREALEPLGGYRFVDASNRVGIVHVATNTRLRVHGSNSKTAFGLVGVPFVVWDEPGAADVIGGERLWDAVSTSQGKPGSPLTAILIGTLAPALAGWWHDLIKGGSYGSIFVQALQGDGKLWEDWQNIRRANPLTMISPELRAKLKEEREQARKDSRLKARFLSFRLNVPSADESTTLLTVQDFERMTGRDVPEREGKPIVGVDMGQNRAWSAAVAVYQSGRIEARALAPGIPSLEKQETRDRVPRGTYQALYDQGVLMVADGLRVPPAALLWAAIEAAWGRPATIICDRFRLDDLKDAGIRCSVVPRVTRWSEASFDIRALRKGAVDGPFSVAEDSRNILIASLSAATVINDDSGNSRMVKKSNNVARDDVAAGLILVAGEWERRTKKQGTKRGSYLGTV